MFQDQAFAEGEADAYFRRNPDAAVAASAEDPVLAALDGLDCREQYRHLPEVYQLKNV